MSEQEKNTTPAQNAAPAAPKPPKIDNAALKKAAAANDVDIHILVAKHIARALFQHGQQQIHTVIVKPACRASWAWKRRFRYKCLNLAQYWPRTFHHAGNAGTGNANRPPFQGRARFCM